MFDLLLDVTNSIKYTENVVGLQCARHYLIPDCYTTFTSLAGIDTLEFQEGRRKKIEPKLKEKETPKWGNLEWSFQCISKKGLESFRIRITSSIVAYASHPISIFSPLELERGGLTRIYPSIHNFTSLNPMWHVPTSPFPFFHPHTSLSSIQKQLI